MSLSLSNCVWVLVTWWSLQKPPNETLTMTRSAPRTHNLEHAASRAPNHSVERLAASWRTETVSRYHIAVTIQTNAIFQMTKRAFILAATGRCSCKPPLPSTTNVALSTSARPGLLGSAHEQRHRQDRSGGQRAPFSSQAATSSREHDWRHGRTPFVFTTLPR